MRIIKGSIRVFGRFLNSATKIYKNKDKVEKILKEVDGKLENNGKPFQGVFVKLKLAISMVNDYVKGDYKKLPMRTLLIIVASAMYIVSPLDAVLDFLPVVGYLDDIFIFNLVYRQISKDVEEYLIWSKNKVPRDPEKEYIEKKKLMVDSLKQE